MLGNKVVARSYENQSRPLCCRYLFGHFEALVVQLLEGDVVRDQVARWAFGVLADGQCEVLGVWVPVLDVMACQEVCAGLRVRGVERIRYVMSNESGVLAVMRAAYPRATVLPSIGSLLGQGLAPRPRRMVLWGDEAAQELSRSLSRAVGRHGCFASRESAVSFLESALGRAERGLGAFASGLDSGYRVARVGRGSTMEASGL